MYIKNVNWDHVRTGSRVLLGGEPHIKISPMVGRSEITGELCYDARLIPEFAGFEPPMVDWEAWE